MVLCCIKASKGEKSKRSQIKILFLFRYFLRAKYIRKFAIKQIIMRLPHLEKTGRKGEKMNTVIEVLKSRVVLSKLNKYKKASPTIPVRNILDKNIPVEIVVLIKIFFNKLLTAIIKLIYHGNI